MADYRPRLLTWLRSNRMQHDFERLDCLHVSGDGKKPNLVKKWELTEEMDPEFIVSDVEQAVENDAAGLPDGVQSYCMLAFKGKEQISRLTIRIANESHGSANDVGSSEPATPTGMLAQAMRHTEAFAKMAIGAFGESARVQANIIRTQADRMEAVEARQMKMIEATEELLSMGLDRRLREEQQAFDQKIKSDAITAFKPLVPVIANRIMGKRLLQEGDKPVAAAVRGLMETFSNDDIMKFRSMMSPTQFAAFASLYDTVSDPDEEPKPKTANGAGN